MANKPSCARSALVFMQGRSISLGSYGIPLLLALSALLLRLSLIEDKSIWVDEAFTAVHSNVPWLEHWTSLVTNKPPLYFHITSLFWSPGDSDFMLRLPAVFFGTLSVYLAWFLGKSVSGHRTAFTFALFMLLSDINVQYSQEARSYILLTVGWVLTLFATIELIKDASIHRHLRRNLLWLFVGSALMINAHLIAIIYLFVLAIGFIYVLYQLECFHWKNVVYPAGIICLAMTTIVPWLINFLSNNDEDFNWLAQATPLNALKTFTEILGGHGLTYIDYDWMALAGFFLGLIAISGFLVYAANNKRAWAPFWIGVLLLPAILIYAIGFIKPVYMLRTLIPTHVVVLLGFSLFCTLPKRQYWYWITTALISAVLLFSTCAYFFSYQKEDWKGLARELKTRVQPQDVVLLCPNWSYSAFAFYFMHSGQSFDDMTAVNGLFTLHHAPSGELFTNCHGTSCRMPLPALPPTLWLIKREEWSTVNNGCAIKDMYQGIMRLTGGKLYVPAAEDAWIGYRISATPYRLRSDYFLIK